MIHLCDDGIHLISTLKMAAKDCNKLRARFLKICAVPKKSALMEFLSMMVAMLMAVSVAYGIYI